MGAAVTVGAVVVGTAVGTTEGVAVGDQGGSADGSGVGAAVYETSTVAVDTFLRSTKLVRWVHAHVTLVEV